jgi:hypothetical protein
MIRLWDGENFIEREAVAKEEELPKGPGSLEEAREKYITGYAKLQFDPETVQRGVDRYRVRAEQHVFQTERQRQADRRAAGDRPSPFDVLVAGPVAGPAAPTLPPGLQLRKKRKRDDGERLPIASQAVGSRKPPTAAAQPPVTPSSPSPSSPDSLDTPDISPI